MPACSTAEHRVDLDRLRGLVRIGDVLGAAGIEVEGERGRILDEAANSSTGKVVRRSAAGAP
jgi:hypothetical protein